MALNPERWQQIADLFDRVVDLPAAEQASLFDAECAHDPALREEVESLLSNADDGDSDQQFLGSVAQAARAAQASVVPERSTLEIGDEIAGYRILGVLGAGGFGTVYRAQQSAPVEREVALKIVHAAGATATVIERFEFERQTLARMSHPGIARVYDAGETAEGLPYFVMELVEGKAITTFCERQKLDLGARLELFRGVCSAVQHAHQRGVIHRDLKPSNVLVVDDGAVPRPMVIDFGIARALHQGGSEQDPRLTSVRQVVGTLEYMCPEQATFGDAEVDTRSDVYSLGVLLYELLTGSTPLAGSLAANASLEETLREVREREPDRPSLRATTAPHQRDTSNTLTSRTLRGDLDWITLKALEKDPERRYVSAAALSADLKRHLSNLPVEAGPPSRRYWVQKFYRRNRGGVVAAAVALVALLVGFTVAVVGQRRAALERDGALAAEESARQVSRFLVQIFEGVNPKHAQGRDVLAREILDRGVPQIDGFLEDQPQVALQLYSTVGSVYKELGLYEDAERTLTRAVALVEAEVGHGKMGAELELAQLYDLQNRTEEAEVLVKQSLAERQKRFGERSAEAADALAVMASVRASRDGSVAHEFLQEVLEIRRENFGEQHVKVGESLRALAEERSWQRKFLDAVPFYERALGIFEAEYGPHHPDTLATLSGLVGNLATLRDAERGLELAERAIGDTKTVFGEHHPATADAIANRGEVHYRATKDYEAALADFETAERILRKVWPADHPDLTMMKRRKAYALEGTKDYEALLALHFEVLEADLRQLGPEHGQVMRQYYNVGAVARALGDYETAAEYLERHVEFNGVGVWRTDHNYCKSAIRWGHSLMELGDYDRARDFFETCYQLEVDEFGEGYKYSIESIEFMLDLADRTGDEELTGVWQQKLRRYREARATAEEQESG